MSEWLSRLVSRLFRSDGGAPKAIKAQRLDPPVHGGSGDPLWMVGGGSERGLSKEYRGGGSVWKDLTIAALFVVVGIAVTRPGLVDHLLHGPPAAAAQGDVLLVSAQSADAVAVRQTVLPRGYNALIVTNADDGIARMQSAGNQIVFIVVDTQVAGANRVMNAAKTSRPSARLIVLKGERQVGDVASRLVDAGMR